MFNYVFNYNAQTNKHEIKNTVPEKTNAVR